MISATRITVPPASGRRESLAVLLLVAAILILSSGVVLLHRDSSETLALPEWQVDLRSGLNAAEQGLSADLLNAVPEMPHLPDTSPEALADEGLPPFVADVTAQARGQHSWQRLQSGTVQAWLGLPARREIARPILLRVAGDTPTIWITDQAGAGTGDLTDAALIAAGWKQVATRFDASVTREDRH